MARHRWWHRKPKCCFCKLENPEKVISWGIYDGTARYYYHQLCIEKVCYDPKKHGHRIVDLALRILEEIEDIRERNKIVKEKFERSCQKLKEINCGKT